MKGYYSFPQRFFEGYYKASICVLKLRSLNYWNRGGVFLTVYICLYLGSQRNTVNYYSFRPLHSWVTPKRPDHINVSLHWVLVNLSLSYHNRDL